MIKYETYTKDKFSNAVSQLPSGYAEGSRAVTFRNIFKSPVLSGWIIVEPTLEPTNKGKVNVSPKTTIASTGLPDSMFGRISRSILCIARATDAAYGLLSEPCGKCTRHMGTPTHRTGLVRSTGAKVPFFARTEGIPARMVGTIARTEGIIDWIARKWPHIVGFVARLMGSFALTMRINTDFVLPDPTWEGIRAP